MAVTYTPSTGQIQVAGYSLGTPCTFNDIHTADLAGTLQLLAPTATALGLTLTYQVQPAEERALKIDFVLAGTNAGAGDTVDITGTGCDAAAQTESIDVSGGDGTYTSTKFFRTITNVDCTGFSDAVGTVEIIQNRWGAFWKTSPYTADKWALTSIANAINCFIYIVATGSGGYLES